MKINYMFSRIDRDKGLQNIYKRAIIITVKDEMTT